MKAIKKKGNLLIFFPINGELLYVVPSLSDSNTILVVTELYLQLQEALQYMNSLKINVILSNDTIANDKLHKLKFTDNLHFYKHLVPIQHLTVDNFIARIVYFLTPRLKVSLTYLLYSKIYSIQTII